MVGGEPQRLLIQLLVNYWEMRPSAMGARLDELLRHGVSHVTTFIPWQAVESDISHTLVRFLQATSERKMTVSLILTPEVGVHYANSGLPKDILSKPDHLARHALGGPVAVSLPPNAFAAPSLLSPEFTKRYHNFLTRLDNILWDLGRTQPAIVENVTAVLTGSFWKYYRSPQLSAARAFGGGAGDYSGTAAVAYRQRLDQFYSQREFAQPNIAAANRWKTRALEDINRRWFYQQSEDVFRNRSLQFVRKKARQVSLREIELYTPEADPAFAYSNFLQLVSGSHADFCRLSQLVDESATRASLGGGEAAAPFIHWTGLGGFRTLSDSEKQFLILKSLLLMGGRGGGILIDEGEWFALSQTFRSRAEALARSIGLGDMRLRTRVLYLAPHLWSSAGTLWEELETRVGPGARLVSSLDLVLRDRESNLLVVDPSWIFTEESVQKLVEWAKGGRVLVLPRSPLYTDAARAELEQALEGPGGMDIDLGVSYRLQPAGTGKLVIYDLPEGLSMKGESLSAWQTFLASVLSVAGIQGQCSLSDGRLRVIPMERRGNGLGLFILNGTSRSVAADILFPVEVSVSDLAVSISADRASLESAEGVSPQGMERPAGATAERAPVVPANRFALEVPPCGILPIAVDGIGGDVEGRREAALTDEDLRGTLDEAAMSELPGFHPDEDLKAKWS